MALVLSDQSEVDMLTFYFAQAMTLRLFVNNFTPVKASVAADFTEASGNGYAAIPLTGGGWTITPGDPKSLASYVQQTFGFSGALGNVYGYFITRDSDGSLRFSERFSDGPYNVRVSGDQIQITPNFTLE